MDERTPRQNFSQDELETMRREVLAWIERDHRRRAPPVVAAGEKPPRQPTRHVVKRRRQAGQNQTTAPPPAVPVTTGGPPARPSGGVPGWPLQLPPDRAGPPRKQRRGQPRKTRRQPRRGLMRYGMAGAGLGLAVVATLVYLLGVYRWSWHGRVTAAVARFTPLPAATVGSKVLWISDFLADVETLRHQARRTGRPVEEAALRQTALARFAAEVALDDLALRSQVTVNDDEIRSQLKQLAQEFGSGARLHRAVRGNFPGWDSQRFSQKLLRPYLLELKLRARMWQDPRAWEAAAVRLKGVWQSVAAGTQSFAEAARLNNRDGSAAVGGDLGYRGPAELDSTVLAAVAGLPDGAISSPLRTARGYLLMQREGTVGEGIDRRLRLRQIIVTPEVLFEVQMSDALGQRTRRRFVP